MAARIMVVDDSSVSITLAGQALSRAGYEVFYARSGPEALIQVHEWRPDLIVLDVMMPGMDGHEVLRRLKSLPETSAVPVIMLTALSTRRDVQSLLADGACDYVIKPFAPDVLVQRVRKALSNTTAAEQVLLGPKGAPLPTPDFSLQDSSSLIPRHSSPLLFVIAYPKCWQADVLARRLQSRGSLSITDNGAEALALALNDRPQVLFTALELDGMGGQELVLRLRQAATAGSTYVICLGSAADNPAEKEQLLAAGFDDVLSMPPSPHEIDRILKRLSQPRATGSAEKKHR